MTVLSQYFCDLTVTHGLTIKWLPIMIYNDRSASTFLFVSSLGIFIEDHYFRKQCYIFGNIFWFNKWVQFCGK